MTPDAGPARRIGWYHGWNIVAVCVLAQALANGLPINTFSLFLRGWSTDLHSPISSLQLGLTALGLVSALLSPFVGVLADKYPARWLIFGGLLAIALFSFGVSFAAETWQLQTLYALVLPLGVAFAASVPANAVVSRWFVRRRGMALGLTAFGLGLAGAILPPVIAAVLPAFGWRAIWRAAGAVTLLIVIPLVLWVVKDRPAERDGLHYLTGDDGAAPNSHGHGGKSDLSWREVFGRRNFWLLLITYLPMLALWGGCAQNLAPIAESQGLSQQTAGLLLSAFSLSMVSSTLIMGLLSDRFGNRVPLSGLALVVAIGGVIVAFGHSLSSLGVGVVLVGAGGGLWTILPAAAAVEFGARGVGRAFGLLALFVPVISLVPFLVAKTQEMTGSYALALIGLAALTCLGSAACFFFMRERRQGKGAGTAKPAAIGTPAA
jgi:MFS family permease